MRILFLGAGATGGYFGGRLMQSGQNVTFLVRPRRQAQLMEQGLVIDSTLGNLRMPVQMVTRATAPYDLVVLTAKAYDLDAAIDSIRPAVGPDTLVLPLLNGLNHLDRLDAAFGAERVLGGLCGIFATLDPAGIIRITGKMNLLVAGARQPAQAARVTDFISRFAGTSVDAVDSPDILQDMWEKFVLITTLAGSTCLMRAPIGAILATPDGAAFLTGLWQECQQVATAHGHAPRPAAEESVRSIVTAQGSPATASMLRDIEKGGPIEAEHILGDMLRRGRDAGLTLPLLTLATTHVRAYEARWAMQAAQTP
jgi:2-dehydropantoate 2-reductase